jgi:hypothetical protein
MMPPKVNYEYSGVMIVAVMGIIVALLMVVSCWLYSASSITIRSTTPPLVTMVPSGRVTRPDS